MKDKLVLEEELESLRVLLNKNINKCIEYNDRKEYKSLLALIRKLDDIIVNYIKCYTNKSKIIY